ncbi:MAG: S-adenosylmethionine:tRNA ribosyltransferase-isomerase, partial [Desulfatiglandales bacterium]
MLSDYDYSLPPELIAQTPLEDRASSRLMTLNEDYLEHGAFRDVIGLLDEGDVVVVNNTKVVPSRIYGTKDTGGNVEGLLIKGDNTKWLCLLRGRNIKQGTSLDFRGHKATVIAKEASGYTLEFEEETS